MVPFHFFRQPRSMFMSEYVHIHRASAYDLLSADFYEALLGLLKVDHVPDCVEVVRLDVLILQIECVLPDVDTYDGGVRDQRVLISSGDYFQLFNLSIPSQPTPPASLYSCRLRIERLLERLKAAKRILDRLAQLWCSRIRIGSPRRGRGEVGPEERVVDVPPTVEFESCLERDFLFCVAGFRVGFFSCVEACHIGLMMFGMVKFHDFF